MQYSVSIFGFLFLNIKTAIVIFNVYEFRIINSAVYDDDAESELSNCIFILHVVFNPVIYYDMCYYFGFAKM